jgi:hypothetical protein
MAFKNCLGFIENNPRAKQVTKSFLSNPIKYVKFLELLQPAPETFTFLALYKLLNHPQSTMFHTTYIYIDNQIKFEFKS